jgi:hypothetical protein
MIQELLDRWSEIKKRYHAGETPTVTRISEELNVLEAFRFAGLKVIPGEAFDIEFLINDRHRRLTEMSGKSGGSPVKGVRGN